MSVNEVLRTDRRFSTLVASLDSTGLDTTLSEAGPFTLLAPPDSAFDALPDGTVPLLLSERRDRLRTILAHHVIDGRLDSATTTGSTVATTLRGDTLSIDATDSTLSVENATVLDGVDVENGVIHVVDRVLLPPRSE